MLLARDALREWRQAGPWRIAGAGVAGAAAYLGEMWLDEALFNDPTDDLVLLGGFVSRHPLRSRAAGLAAHTLNGVALACLYAAIARPRLAGPAWARGLALATAENAALWPLVAALDVFHPWIRAGRLPTYNRGVPWLQAVLRHVAYGAVMGALLGLPPRRGTVGAAAARLTASTSSSAS